MIHNYTVADFFCGAGGFSEGFHQAGFDVIFSLDNWKPAIETHKLNHPNCNSVIQNILELNTPEKIDAVVPDTDIIIGSPPCVSFSNSNKSTKLHNKDDNDLTEEEKISKNLGLSLMKAFLRIILYKKSKPNSKLKYWCLENVENSKKFFLKEKKEINGNPLKDSKKQTVYEDIKIFSCEDLDLPDFNTTLEIKYLDDKDIKSNVLNSYDYGAPQNRKRLILGNHIKPEKTSNKFSMKDVFNNLGSVNKSEIDTEEVVTDLLFKDTSLRKQHLTDHYYDTTIPKEMWIKAKRLKQDHGFMGKMSFPENILAPARTVMATESFSTRESMIFQKNDEVDEYRGATIRESACFMGFPINYQFTGTRNNKHKQIGNAVCVPLSYAIALGIKKDIINKETQRRFGLLKVNLNNLDKPIHSNFKIKSKKINSKYHRHPPNLKICTFRCELSNTDSDFQTIYIWNSHLHKGSGKDSLKTVIKNDILIPILKKFDLKLFNIFRKKIELKFREEILSGELLQQKYCLIEFEDHEKLISPDDILKFISDKINELDISNDIKIKNSNFDKELKESNKEAKKSDKPYEYPIKILYSLYALNMVVDITQKS